MPPKKRRSSATSKKPKLYSGQRFRKCVKGVQARNRKVAARGYGKVAKDPKAVCAAIGRRAHPKTFQKAATRASARARSMRSGARNPRRMPAEAINRNIYDDLNAMSVGGTGDHLKGWPEGHWGDVKTIVSWFRGNELSTLANFFVGSMKKGPVKFAHEFYIDDRVYGSPVHTDWTRGRVGKRDVNAALKRLYAVGKKTAKTHKLIDYSKIKR